MSEAQYGYPLQGYKEKDTTANIQPLGFYCLIQVDEVKDLSAGGIYVGDSKREQDACETGYLVAIGNTAFAGFAGCNPESYPPSHEFHSLQPYQIWGLEIGDRVEYRRYEGKLSGVKGIKNMRYIPDTQIIGKVN